MSDCTNPPHFAPDLETLVAEDRAEIVPFRTVGAVVQTVSEQCIALRGFRLQLMLIERNSDDPVIRVAAAQALATPNADTIRVLLQSVRGTPRFLSVQHVLTELAIAHADTVFASESVGK